MTFAAIEGPSGAATVVERRIGINAEFVAAFLPASPLPSKA